jgi:hypothetical protein
VILAQFIHNSDPETQENTLLCLHFLSHSAGNDGIVAISSYGLNEKIIKFINNENERIAYNALRCVGNLSLGENKVTGVRDITKTY